MRYTPFTNGWTFFIRKDGRVMLPVTGSFHHAVNDGYHAEKFSGYCRRISKKE